MAIPPIPNDEDDREFFRAKVKILVVAFVIVALMFLFTGCLYGGGEGESSHQTEALDNINHTLQSIATETAGCE